MSLKLSYHYAVFADMRMWKQRSEL